MQGNFRLLKVLRRLWLLSGSRGRIKTAAVSVNRVDEVLFVAETRAPGTERLSVGSSGDGDRHPRRSGGCASFPPLLLRNLSAHRRFEANPRQEAVVRLARSRQT